MREYHVTWLRSRALPRALKLAGRLGSTAVSIPELSARYDAADQRGDNISVALWRGARLVGYLFAFVQSTSGEPAAKNGSGPQGLVVNIDGVGVARRHRRGFQTLATRFSNVLRHRADLRELSVVAPCIPRIAELWSARPRFFARLGYRLVNGGEAGARSASKGLILEPRSSAVPARRRTLATALQRVRTQETAAGTARIGTITNVSDWELLEPHWNRLLAATDGGTVFQSYEYLRTWWHHLGWPSRLNIIVVLVGEEPVAIAPLELSQVNWFRIPLRRLGFIGLAPESDRPTNLIPAGEECWLEPLVRYIADDTSAWDILSLTEQRPDSAFAQTLAAELKTRRCMVREVTGPACPIVTVQGTWAAFLGSKNKAFRKSIKRKSGALEEAGRVDFEVIAPSREEPIRPFERYLSVERQSWKAGTAISVAQTPADLALYRALIACFARLGAAEFRFLSLDGHTIAATFGLLWGGRYHSLHIAHDEAFAKFSPGVVLTSKELENVFADRRYEVFDFLSGVLPNKGTWATETLPSKDVSIIQPTLLGRLYCGVTHYVKPKAKAIVGRLKLAPVIARIKALLKRSEWDRD